MNNHLVTGNVAPGMEKQSRNEATEPTGDDGMLVLSYVISGLLFYGGLGWLADHYLHQKWMLPLGLIIGLCFSVYSIIKRYGSRT